MSSQEEPVSTISEKLTVRNASVGYVKDFVAALLALAVLFGLPLTEQQMAGILLVITTGGALWLGLNDRQVKKQ